MKCKVLVAAGMLCTGGIASAETVDEALSNCSKEKNSLQRLVCYDKLVKDLNQYQGLDKSVTRDRVNAQAGTAKKTQQSDVVAKPAPRRQPEPEAGTDFGMEHKQDVSDKADSMTATITELRETVTGKLVIGLSNGTVWQQTGSKNLKIENKQSVTIERGWLGAFYLSKEGVNTRLKVKRIK